MRQPSAARRPRPSSERELSQVCGHLFRFGQRALEIGPDREPSTYRQLLPEPVGAWDTLDFAARTDIPLTYRAHSEHEFPVFDDSYDVVFSAQVIEHVRKIWRWMPEVARVCRPGGVVNRQSASYARQGIKLDVSTLADWVGACATTLAPLVELIRRHVFAAERIHGDDTTVPVLAKGKTITARLWTYLR